MDLFKTTEVSKPSRVAAYNQRQEQSSKKQATYVDFVNQTWRAGAVKEMIAQRTAAGRGGKIQRVIQSVATYVQSAEFIAVVESNKPPRQGELWRIFVDLLYREMEIDTDCWIIPYKGKLTISPKPEYYRREFMRDANIARVQPGVVYPDDEFELSLGTDPYIFHKPKLQGENEKKKAYCAYLVIWKKGDGAIPSVIRYLDQRQLRERQGSQTGPWLAHEKAMIEAKAWKLGASFLTPDYGLILPPDTVEKIQKEAEAQGTLCTLGAIDISDMDEVEEVPAILENNAQAPMEVVAPAVSKKETVETVVVSKKDTTTTKALSPEQQQFIKEMEE